MPKTKPFEEHADAYDRWFDRHRDLYSAELTAVRKVMPTDVSGSLEIGVGTGRFAVPLDIETGLEPSRQMAVIARSRGVNVVAGIAEALPFRDRQFSVAVMITTICFVDDIGKTFREAFRVLKPAGSLIVGFVDRESVLGRQYIEKKEDNRFYRNATFFSARDVLSLYEQAGFTRFAVRQTLISGESTGHEMDGFGRGGFVVIQGLRPAD